LLKYLLGQVAPPENNGSGAHLVRGADLTGLQLRGANVLLSQAGKESNMVLLIPLNQMILFVALTAFCFLFSRYKLGLSITFCFTFYWGFIYNKDAFFTDLEGSSHFLVFYFFSGAVLILFALFSFLTKE
jgi:hypothetical protein